MFFSTLNIYDPNQQTWQQYRFWEEMNSLSKDQEPWSIKGKSPHRIFELTKILARNWITYLRWHQFWNFAARNSSPWENGPLGTLVFVQKK